MKLKTGPRKARIFFTSSVTIIYSRRILRVVFSVTLTVRVKSPPNSLFSTSFSNSRNLFSSFRIRYHTHSTHTCCTFSEWGMGRGFVFAFTRFSAPHSKNSYRSLINMKNMPRKFRFTEFVSLNNQLKFRSPCCNIWNANKMAHNFKHTLWSGWRIIKIAFPAKRKELRIKVSETLLRCSEVWCASINSVSMKEFRYFAIKQLPNTIK